MSFLRNRSSVSAFTLMESLIATAIIAVTATSVYYAFLRMNDYAVSSRCDTAAKIALERAVNLAMTTDWSSASIPPILAPTSDFKTFNPDTGLDSDGSVSLFSDPSNNTIISGTISRKVIPYPNIPADKAIAFGNIYQITFKLDYKTHKRADQPNTTVYAYTVRAGDQ